MERCIYYVYMYLKENGTPFYVGKGKGNRHLAHLQEAKKSSTKDTNKLKINTIKKMLNEGKEPSIVFVDKNIDEDSAFELEEFLISEIGRIDLKTGTLTNLTNGGDGASGTIITESTRNKRRLKMQGVLNPNFGKKDTPEMIEVKRQRMLGRKMPACSEERRENIRKATTGVKKSTTENMCKPRSKVVCSHCNKEGGSNTMHRWHFDNCKLKETENASE